MISSLHHARARARRAGQPVAPYAPAPADALAAAQAENERLRARVAELEALLAAKKASSS